MEFEFAGPVVEWRGPAPYYFVEIPAPESADIKEAARGIEYWGQVPVLVRIDGVDFTTALFPKDGVYLLPLKVAVQKKLGLDGEAALGREIRVGLDVGRP